MTVPSTSPRESQTILHPKDTAIAEPMDIDERRSTISPKDRSRGLDKGSAEPGSGQAQGMRLPIIAEQARTENVRDTEQNRYKDSRGPEEPVTTPRESGFAVPLPANARRTSRAWEDDLSPTSGGPFRAAQKSPLAISMLVGEEESGNQREKAEASRFRGEEKEREERRAGGSTYLPTGRNRSRSPPRRELMTSPEDPLLRHSIGPMHVHPSRSPRGPGHIPPPSATYRSVLNTHTIPTSNSIIDPTVRAEDERRMSSSAVSSVEGYRPWEVKSGVPGDSRRDSRKDEDQRRLSNASGTSSIFGTGFNRHNPFGRPSASASGSAVAELGAAAIANRGSEREIVAYAHAGPSRQMERIPDRRTSSGEPYGQPRVLGYDGVTSSASADAAGRGGRRFASLAEEQAYHAGYKDGYRAGQNATTGEYQLSGASRVLHSIVYPPNPHRRLYQAYPSPSSDRAT